MSAEFQDMVAERQERDAEREFMRAAEEAGYDVRPAAEIARPTPLRPERAAGADEAAMRDASSFRRRVPKLPEDAGDAPEVRRKLRRGSGRREVKFSTELVPIFVTNSTSGKEYKLWARRVPATEMGYLERLENILSDIRLEMRRLRQIKDQSDQRKLERLNGEYNKAAEEYLAFQLEMPDGFYADLNTAGLTHLQRELQELMRGDDIEQGEDDAGN